MSTGEILLGILVMVLVTYGPRVLPLLLLRRQLQSAYLQAFFAYVPYAVIAAMTVPDIFFAASQPAAAVLGTAAALLLAYRGRSLITVALGGVAVVFLVESVLLYF